MKSRFLVLLLGLGTFSCATRPLQDSQLRQLSDVGVFVYLNPRLPLQYLQTRTEDVRWVEAYEWGAPSLMAFEITQAVEKAGKKVIPVFVNPQAALEALKKGDSAVRRDFGDVYAELRAVVLETAAKSGVKTLFWVRPDRDRMKSAEAGMSMLCQRVAGRSPKWQLSMQIHAELIDVPTAKVLSSATFRGEELMRRGTEHCMPSQNADSAQVAGLYRGEFQALAREAGQKILKKTGFTR